MLFSLANHITYVHTHNTFPPLDHTPVSKDYLRCVNLIPCSQSPRLTAHCSNYIAHAKTFSPVINAELKEYVADLYVTMREEAALVTCFLRPSLRN